MKNIGLNILGGVLALALITGLMFYFGVVGNLFDSTITKQHLNIERDNFKESKSYVEGMVQDLSKYQREYDRATTDEEKQQILSYVANEYSNFDINNIESINLQNFLLKARGE